MQPILIFLPQTDFDPTEVAVPWLALREAGYEVVFATPAGAVASCDPITLTGKGLPFQARSLRAHPENIDIYQDMIASGAFRNPVKWTDVAADDFAGLLFPGGHAPGMKPYLESQVVQQVAIAAFAQDKPVSAICHGIIPLARARRADGLSLLHGRKTTALTGKMESIGHFLTRGKLGDHYRTYPTRVEEEVKAALASPADFKPGPLVPRYATAKKPMIGHVVKDGNYLSARWPGDAWTLATEFCQLLENRE